MMGQCFAKMTRFRRKSTKRCKQLKTTFRFNRIEVNALISMDGYDDVTQLWLAVRFDDEALAAGLIEIGADVNLACGGLLMSPLHLAVGNQNIEILKKLLEAGANPNVMDKWNYTPLMYAAIHFDASVVNDLFKVLLQHGAEVNYGACIDKSGVMVNARNVDLFELRSGGDCDYITYVKDPMGPTSGTALHHALQNPHLPNESVEILLHNGADINLPNLHGQTCLMGVLRDVYYDYHTNVKSHAQLLLSVGADPNARDRRGWSCFHYAAQRGSISGMELLLSANGDCNLSSHVGESPLWLLLVCGWREASEYLIRSGCDVDRPASSHIILYINQNVDICRYGDIRPLEFALCNRYYKIAKLIVQSNCQVDLNTWLGNQGAQPTTEHEDFMEFLQEHMSAQKSVKTLIEICRDSFRKSNKQGMILKLKSCILPQPLKDYLCLGSIT